MLQKIKNYYHLAVAVLANLWYGFPSRSLTMIGVTGTDGKTTTSSMIYHILKESGVKVAMITTVGAYMGDKVYDIGFHVTTPSSFAIQKYLKKARDMGITHVVLEVTSHALDQNRPWGIHFQVGVITNVSHEHLDYHKQYEQYVHAKARLLQHSDISIVNADDQSYPLLRPLLQHQVVYTYGDSSEANETSKSLDIKTNLLGSFNRYNALAAAMATREVGILLPSIRKALSTFTPPKGRQEIVYNKECTVMIDFAHTPNAFTQLLPEIKKRTKGRVIHVFGAASQRDTSKRPFMGEESAKYADIIILTAEDPRKEPIEAICKEIATGITQFREVRDTYVPKKNERNLLYIISDRKKAIEAAVELAQNGDYVVLTGKSHETSMNYGSGEEPWDEFAVVREAIKKKYK